MSSTTTATVRDVPPQPIGSPLAAYSATLALIGRLGARQVLDCPAGKGAFAWQLRQSGVDVTCADIDPAQFELDGPCSFADLNETVPYADGQFDVVTCQNGLHRVWARGRAVGELARVTKPGGHVVFTFVNNNNLWRRLMYMLSGSVIHDINGPPHNFYPEARNPAAHYRYPMTVAQVVSSMRSAGLEVTELSAFKWSVKAMLLAPVAVLPWLFSLMAPSAYRQYGFLGAANSLHALFGDYLIVSGKKVGATPRVEGAEIRS
jgi:ubiquinone/menaquinone biosynthesis C-methylase UbiE